jgi:predicted phosphodiesterase
MSNLNESLRILVISDIHAFAGNPLADDAVSYFCTREVGSPGNNPFLAIPSILSDENLQVDWILCPGDLADRADPTAQAIAWDHLEKLREKVGAEKLICTVGNHDVDSRLSYDEFDTKGSLQSLRPLFPGLAEPDCDFFWSRNFAVVEEEKVLLLVLNSSAFHGINSEKASVKEFEHGRVSDRTIAAIEARLSGKSKPLQILLTHHHFYKNDKIFSADYSQMKNGTSLLDMLSEKVGSNWFVLHGHQHFPKIAYGFGDGASATVFSAGSFSRKLNELSSTSANQFYHIEFPIAKYQELGWNSCGVCRAWDWSPSDGWLKARGVAKIPSRAGFGCRDSAELIADRIVGMINSTAAVEWSKIVETHPAIAYVLPSDIKRIIDALDQRNIAIYGEPFSGRCQLSLK